MLKYVNMNKILHTIVISIIMLITTTELQAQYWDRTPYIGENGVMEVGKYIDFHETNNPNVDYDARLYYHGERIMLDKGIRSSGQISIPLNGAEWDEKYNGNISLIKTKTSGQYINIIRNGCYPWSIGTVYNSNTFAIGEGKINDAEFTNPAISITTDMNVGIGTATPDAKLTVNGTIHAKEVLIDLNGPLADYVFEPDYVLPSLSKVKQYIQENKHLPDIPSATQVEQCGLSVGEMQNLLLQKIEELTLYTIELKEEIERLKANK